MKNFYIKSYCKINLTLQVIKKLRNGYHNISSIITFCDLYDIISVSKTKNSKDIISFSGKFKNGINKKINTATKVLKLIRKNKLLVNQNFIINIKKNIPHGSGLGSGSANAADLLNYFNSKMKLKLSKKKIKRLARKIGFDVPISLERKNTFLTGEKDKILRIKNKFSLNLLIVYPNLICSTKKIYKLNKNLSKKNSKTFLHIKNNKKLIDFFKNQSNDLEKTVIKVYPKVKKILNYIKTLKGCYFSRITGSGSACIGIFSNINNANNAKKMINSKYPKYWCAVSKTI